MNEQDRQHRRDQLARRQLMQAVTPVFQDLILGFGMSVEEVTALAHLSVDNAAMLKGEVRHVYEQR